MQLDWLCPHQQYLEQFRELLQRWRHLRQHFQMVLNLEEIRAYVLTIAQKIWTSQDQDLEWIHF